MHNWPLVSQLAPRALRLRNNMSTTHRRGSFQHTPRLERVDPYKIDPGFGGAALKGGSERVGGIIAQLYEAYTRQAPGARGERVKPPTVPRT